MSINFDIAVIGGGPAGLLAAGRASMLGARVVLLEKMEKPARKLRITGKGRCNLTSMRTFDEYMKEISPEPRFLRHAFGGFFNQQVIDLLGECGVRTVLERGQRVFPASGKAWDVAEAIVRWAKRQGVEIISYCRVERIINQASGVFGLDLVNTKTGQRKSIVVKLVIVATGGQSYPATGSTGDGYRFAESLGHSIVPLRPSLVGLHTKPIFRQANGMALRNVQLSLWINGRKVQEEFGEVEFTGQGLDGPAILRISRMAIEGVVGGLNVELSIDLKPALDFDKLDARLVREIGLLGAKGYSSLLRKLVPAQLVPVIALLTNLEAQKPVGQLTAANRRAIISTLKDLRFSVIGHGGWDEAIVTAGGVSLNEVDPKTLGSKLVNGLYFAGEVLDLDGNTGGYNLQIAFSTGWLAGESAALAFKKVTQSTLKS